MMKSGSIRNRLLRSHTRKVLRRWPLEMAYGTSREGIAVVFSSVKFNTGIAFRMSKTLLTIVSGSLTHLIKRESMKDMALANLSYC